MNHIFNYIDTHPAILGIVLLAAIGLLMYLIYEYDDHDNNHTDRYYSPKP